MPKMKTRKAAAKRISISGSGKLMSRHARTGHMKARKSKQSKRRLSIPAQVSSSDTKQMKRALPYLGKQK